MKNICASLLTLFIFTLTFLVPPATANEAAQATATLFGSPVSQGEGDIVEAEVTEVCKNKGCWMKVKTATEERFVRFKDYGFFVPKDIKGKKIKMKAVSVTKEVSEKDQKHYLKDAGASDEEMKKVKGSISRTEWLASGVELVPAIDAPESKPSN